MKRGLDSELAAIRLCLDEGQPATVPGSAHAVAVTLYFVPAANATTADTEQSYCEARLRQLKAELARYLM